MSTIKRVGQGSAAILRAIVWYLLALEETGATRAKATLGRLIGWGITSWFVGYMLLELGLLWWALGVGWTVSALYATTMPDDLQDDEEELETPEETEEHDIVAALHEVGDGKSVHLAALAAHLNLQLGDVHALLTEAEIPTRHSVKVKGAVAVGVHKDDIPPLPSPTSEDPEEAPVAGSAAGQSATATATPFVVRQTERGPEIWVDNPLNPAETVILRPAHREAS